MAVLIIGFSFSILSPKSKKLFYLYLFLLLILASFRYGVGPDYFGYESLYAFVNTPLLDQFRGDDTRLELGFRMLGSSLNSIGLSYQQYLALIALITLFYLGKTFRKYSVYPIVTLCLYFCMFYFVWVYSGIRQGLTLAIGVYYLLECLKTRKHIKFVIIIYLLTLVHSSSLILLLFYVIAHLNLRRRTLFISVFLCFCVSFIPAVYLYEIVSHLPYGERVGYYFLKSNVNINHFDFKSISRLVLLIIIGGFFAKNYGNNSEIQRKILAIYIMSFGVYYALRFVEVLASNASIYGFVLIVVILPNMYGELKAGPNSKVFLTFVAVLSIAFYFKTLNSMEDYSQLNHTSLLTPYTHIFNKSEYSYPLATRWD